MPSVVLTVDCEGAHHDRCFTNEYVKIFEANFVPATWMIHVSMKDPTANTHLYYHEFVHKIPSWHEFGMKVNFENERGYIEDEKERCKVMWLAKDTLKSHRIKATSFRAGGFALMPSDIKYMEEMGVIADSSIVPDADYKMFVDWTGAPHEPYHSAADDLKKVGANRILHVPVATYNGIHGYLHHGFDALKELYEANMNRETICLGLRDYHDTSEDLKKTIDFFRSKGAHFSTLTQAASEHYEHHEALAAASV